MPILLALLLILAPQQKDDTKEELTKADMARHQGTWQTLTFEHEGQSTSADLANSITREVTGDHVVWKRDGKPFSGSTMTIDPMTKPRSLIIVPDGGAGRDKQVKGIYKFEGNNLVICMAEPGQPRPKDFTAGKDSHRTLMTLRPIPTPPRRPRRNP